MAYKKYIRRNGKVYGPYLYESKRIDGKVVTEYHGHKKKEFPKKAIIIIGMLLALIAIILLIINYAPSFTGKVSLDLQTNYIGDEILPQKIDLTLNQGELIPTNTTILIENANNTYEFSLQDLINTEPTTGDYYLQYTSLSGQGLGFGIKGQKQIPETIFFKLKLTSEPTTQDQTTEIPSNQEETTNTSNQEESTQSNESTQENTTESTQSEPTENSSNAQENTSPTQEQTNNNLPEETSQEQTNSESNAIQETTSPPEQQTTESKESTQEQTTTESTETTENSGGTSEPALITGNIISSALSSASKFFLGVFTGKVIENNEIQGDVSKEEAFTYTLPEGTKASILPDSVRTNQETLSESVLKISQEDNKITITTNYVKTEDGFGKEYLTEKTQKYKIDLSNQNITLQEGPTKITLVYNNDRILTTQKTVSPQNSEPPQPKNQTISDYLKAFINKTIEDLLKDQYSENPTLTSEEKKTLKDNFGLAVVKSKASQYKDKILVEFTLENHKIQHYYDSSLSQEELQKSIQRDRIIWLKDLAKELSKTQETTTPKPELDELYPII